MAVLGVDGKRGWVSKIVGTDVDEDLWERFVRAGDKLRNKNRERYSQCATEAKSPPIASPKNTNNTATRQTPANESFNRISKLEREQFYASDDWKDIRMLALRRGGYRCNYCGATKHNSILHVDHKVPLSVDWSRRLDLLNLQVLCADCNVGKRNYHSDDGDKIEGIDCPF